MPRRINFAFLLFLAACATSIAIPPNRYGLRVVPDRATYEKLARADASKRMVDLATIPGVRLDIRYATEDNFMKRPLYPVSRAFLRAPAAEALRRIQEELAREGLGLKVWDAYRPYSITEAMWEPIRNPDYVADPAKGSRHNRGAAVDVTLVDRNGYELIMPTGYDDFTPRAAHAFTDLAPQMLLNRQKLRDVMTKHGFDPLPSEWWHYDFRGWERFELMNVPLEEL
ncbi:MAG TPA: M15 family metallopeptidase [Thermoanaerobaculia bacterium]|nr:M15 family metallopeptidase [Thermoanaerobaculia bacterium]